MVFEQHLYELWQWWQFYRLKKYLWCLLGTFDGKSISFIVSVVVPMAPNMDQICFDSLSHVYNALKNILVFYFFAFWVFPFASWSRFYKVRKIVPNSIFCGPWFFSKIEPWLYGSIRCTIFQDCQYNIVNLFEFLEHVNQAHRLFVKLPQSHAPRQNYSYCHLEVLLLKMFSNNLIRIWYES